MSGTPSLLFAPAHPHLLAGADITQPPEIAYPNQPEPFSYLPRLRLLDIWIEPEGRRWEPQQAKNTNRSMRSVNTKWVGLCTEADHSNNSRGHSPVSASSPLSSKTFAIPSRRTVSIPSLLTFTQLLINRPADTSSARSAIYPVRRTSSLPNHNLRPQDHGEIHQMGLTPLYTHTSLQSPRFAAIPRQSNHSVRERAPTVGSTYRGTRRSTRVGHRYRGREVPEEVVRATTVGSREVRIAMVASGSQQWEARSGV